MKINNTKFQVPENFTAVDFDSLFPAPLAKTENVSDGVRDEIEALLESSSALENSLWELVFAKGDLTDNQLKNFSLSINNAEKVGQLAALIQKLEEGEDFSGLKYQNLQSVAHRLKFLGTDEEDAFENSDEIQDLREAMELVKKSALKAEVTEHPQTRTLMRDLVDIESYLTLKYGNPSQGIINAERSRVIEAYLAEKFDKILKLIELMKEGKAIKNVA